MLIFINIISVICLKKYSNIGHPAIHYLVIPFLGLTASLHYLELINVAQTTQHS